MAEYAYNNTVNASTGLMSCPCASGKGKRNDDKDNHIVGGLVVYQGVVE